MEDINFLKNADSAIELGINYIKKSQPCRQNSIVLTKLEESTMWIYNRIKEIEITIKF